METVGPYIMDTLFFLSSLALVTSILKDINDFCVDRHRSLK
jgi:hypothetical protein